MDAEYEYFPIINIKKTGLKIREQRLQKGISCKELSEILGFASPQAIYKWERGGSLPTVDNLAILGVIFGTTIDDLLEKEKGRKLKLPR